MKETSMTIEQIETLLVGYPSSPFYIRQNIVVPNVDWGFLNHEADLLVLSKANYLTEIEIKRSWSDFMADFKKKHTHYDKKLSHFYYAVPSSIGQRVFDWLYVGEYNDDHYWSKPKVYEPTPNNPHSCGLIVYYDQSEHLPCGHTEIIVEPKRMGTYKVSQEEEIKLLRLCGMRVWNLKKKVAELQKTKGE
jgi:hypothetical protein